MTVKIVATKRLPRGLPARGDVQRVAVPTRMHRGGRRDKHDRPAAFPRGIDPLIPGGFAVLSSAGRAVIMSGHEAFSNYLHGRVTQQVPVTPNRELPGIAKPATLHGSVRRADCRAALSHGD
jgi:hypothetical protein